MGGMGGFPGGFPGFEDQSIDMSEFAKAQTDRLAGALELTGKQYDKIYKIYHDELDRRVNELQTSDSNSGFPGMGGFPGGMGGGPMGGPGMGGPMGGPDGPVEGPDEKSDEQTLTVDDLTNNTMSKAQRTYMNIMAQEPTKKDAKAQQKIEKKMSKILSADQFAKWKEIEKQPMPMMFRSDNRGPRPQGAPQGQRGPQGQGGPQGQRGPQGQNGTN